MKNKNSITNAVVHEFNKVDDPIEKCVICGAETPYKFSTPINKRKYYMEGSGQICQECHYTIYIEKKRDEL